MQDINGTSPYEIGSKFPDVASLFKLADKKIIARDKPDIIMAGYPVAENLKFQIALNTYIGIIIINIIQLYEMKSVILAHKLLLRFHYSKLKVKKERNRCRVHLTGYLEHP